MIRYQIYFVLIQQITFWAKAHLFLGYIYYPRLKPGAIEKAPQLGFSTKYKFLIGQY
jgi:hypothetical protein